METIFDFLKRHEIPYEQHDHPAVFTVEESAALPKFPGADTKNLFLCEDRGDRYFLVTVPHHKRVDLKSLSPLLSAKRLTFGSQEKLKEYLGVEPGSVTLLGLMHDTDHHVDVWIDEEVWNNDAIQCHPLINTATLVVSHTGMEKFFALTGHEIHAADIPSR